MKTFQTKNFHNFCSEIDDNSKHFNRENAKTFVRKLMKFKTFQSLNFYSEIKRKFNHKNILRGSSQNDVQTSSSNFGEMEWNGRWVINSSMRITQTQTRVCLRQKMKGRVEGKIDRQIDK